MSNIPSTTVPENPAQLTLIPLTPEEAAAIEKRWQAIIDSIEKGEVTGEQLITGKVNADQFELPLDGAKYPHQLTETGCARLAFTIYFNCLKDDESSMEEKEACFKEWIQADYPSLTPKRVMDMMRKYPTSVESMVHNLVSGGLI